MLSRVWAERKADEHEIAKLVARITALDRRIEEGRERAEQAEALKRAVESAR